MLSKNAIYLLQKRYCKPGETPEGVFKRVAEFLAEGDRKFEERLFDSMVGGIFLPNSPCLFNAGATKNNGLHACFILPVLDDTTSIFSAVSNMARIFKAGGGVGINFYPLRERGAKLSGGGTSSGQISFMGLFDYTVETVKQGGIRRGALMGINYFYHPEIFDFIRVKLERKLQNFNLSIMVNDEFMKAIDTDKKIQLKSPLGYTTESVKAKDIFEVAAFAAWCNGDPAFLFFDRINKDNPYYPEVIIEATNPCITGDTLVAVADGRSAVSIKQLAEEGREVPVYCSDNQGWKHIRWAKKIRKTQEKAKVYRVELDDRTYVMATSNHNFYLSNGIKKRVEDLSIGDSLLRFDKYKFGYNGKSKGYWGVQRARRNVFQEHRLVKEFELGRSLQKDELIHHLDSNGSNNEWSNLLVTNIKGDNNPLRKLKAQGKFDEFKNRNSGYNQKGENNNMFGRIQTDESKQKNRGMTGDYNPMKNPNIVAKGLRTRMEKKNLNHKIVSIEFYRYEDVYNMEVDDFHNFAIITNNLENSKSGIIISNCSEVGLPSYGACALGSINLSKFIWKNDFNFDRFEEACRLGMRTLVALNKLSYYPLPEIKETMDKYNPVGLGVMGFADSLIKLGIKYDSKECIDFIDKVGELYKKTTEEYAKDKSYFYKRIIAPTGSLSILADCFTGETEIPLLNGTKHSIKKLVGKEFYVYSYDVANRRVVPGKATARKYHEHSKIIKIKLDNGEDIKCTPEHKFLLKDGFYKEAKYLTTEDSLMPLYRRYVNLMGVLDEKGYEQVLQSCEYRDYWVFTHRRTVTGIGKKGEVVHHKDFKKRNNDPSNLEWIEKHQHFELHSKLTRWDSENNPSKRPEIRLRRSENMKGRKNPMKRPEISSKVSKALTGRTISEHRREKLMQYVNTHINPFKGKNHSQISLDKMSFKHKEWMRTHDNPNMRKDVSSEDVKVLRDSGLSWKEIADRFSCCIGTVRSRYSSAPKYRKYHRYVNHTERVDITKEMVLKMRNEGLSWGKIAEELSCNAGLLKRRCPNDTRYLGRNHRIVSTEVIEGKYETYCLEVEGYLNFALAVGVFVHNCSSGIEPIYDVMFERRLVVGLIEETRDLYKSEHVRTALQISPEWHVKVLAQWQKWIDGGVSKTVNLPHDASVDDLKSIYKQAYKSGCKGITVYRDGCRSDQVLVSNTTNKFSMGKCSDDSCTL